MTITKRAPKTITAQAIFNRVWQHFVVEKRLRSVEKNLNFGRGQLCRYRSPRGTLACGVGVLVTDKECAGWDDSGNTAISDIAREFGLPKRLRPHRDLLTSLQIAHDETYGRRLPASRLRDVAHNHGLTIPGAK